MNGIPKSIGFPFVHVIWCWRRTNEFLIPFYVQRTSSISHHTYTVHAIDGHEQIVSFFFIGSLNDHQYFYLVVVSSLSWNMKPFDIVNCEHHRTVCTHANNNDTIFKLNFAKRKKKYLLFLLFLLTLFIVTAAWTVFFVFFLCLLHMWLSPILLMTFFLGDCEASQNLKSHFYMTVEWTKKKIVFKAVRSVR